MSGNVIVTLFIWGVMIGIAFVVRILFFRKTKIQLSNIFFSILIIIFLISSVLLYFHVKVFAEEGSKSSYPHVKGVVISSSVVGGRAIRPEIIYQFDVITNEVLFDTLTGELDVNEIDNVQYIDTTSLNPPMFGGKRKKLDVAEKIVADYPAGKEVVVFYNPGNPQESFITHQITWDILAKLGFFAFLVLVSSFCLMVPRKPKEQSA